MKHWIIIGGVLTFAWLLARPAWAVQYRLQVTQLDYLTFSAHLQKSTPAWRGEETMRRLEERLDQVTFPTSAVIPGREVALLEDPGYGGTPPARLSALPATQNQAWTTFIWEGNPGDSVAFVVKSEMVAWQEVWAVAANPEGPLRRLSIGGPALFGRPWQPVPEASYDFIANAVDRGTFTRWLAQNATALNGMSLVVGRGRSLFNNPDRLYTVIKLPPEPRTFKLVVGWKDHDDRGSG